MNSRPSCNDFTFSIFYLKNTDRGEEFFSSTPLKFRFIQGRKGIAAHSDQLGIGFTISKVTDKFGIAWNGEVKNVKDVGIVKLAMTNYLNDAFTNWPYRAPEVLGKDKKDILEKIQTMFSESEVQND